jgi:hypothetical protein
MKPPDPPNETLGPENKTSKFPALVHVGGFGGFLLSRAEQRK